jgi:serine O-acetyltransferase
MLRLRKKLVVADWSREKPRRLWDPSRRLLSSIRAYQASRGLFRRYHVLRHRFWSVVCGADIPLNARIGGGLLIPHPNGIVIHPDSVIGTNCLLMQQVTLGTNRSAEAPRIGNGVDIGPGAKVLGPVFVGDKAMIGAMSLVLTDVPAGTTAYGIPARVVHRG